MSAEDAPSRRLVAALFGTLKLTQMYGRTHDASADALTTLLEALREVAPASEGAIVALAGRRLQINGRTMRAAECGSLALGYLVDEWGRRGIAALHFRTGVGIEELATFVGVFLSFDPGPRDPGGRFASDLEAAGVRDIIVEAQADVPHAPRLAEREAVTPMRTYVRGLHAFREVLRQDGFPDRGKLRRARRAVQGLIDCLVEDEAVVLTLAHIRGYDPKLFRHSLNVSIYAAAIGQRLGLSRRQLGDLGVAALFHDVGKTAQDPDNGNGRLRLAPAARGARMLLEESASHEGMLKAAVVAYEQRPAPDEDRPANEPHLFSRIVRIADAYDTLTTRPMAGRPPLAPHEAFRRLQAQAGALFDPVLLKVFVNALGLHPVGTLVELTTGETALVVEGPAEPADLDRPTVRILRTGAGSLEEGDVVDLAERSQEGAWLRGILRTLEAHDVFASTEELLASL